MRARVAVVLSVQVLALVVTPSPGGTQAVDDTHAPPAVERVAGPNRFGTAAAVATAALPGADVVYVAPGADFPLALAGGPRAALDGAPVLLAEARRLPAETREALLALGPSSIVLLGSADDLDATVEADLEGIAPVRRIDGGDVAGTVSAIALDGWPDGAETVYVATSRTFPDALTGGAAAAASGSPILLVDAESAPPATLDTLAELGPSRLVLLGGTAAISDEVALQLADATGAQIRREGGPTRIETAIEVSQDAHRLGADAEAVFLATADNFPDALAAAPAVAAVGGTLLLTPAGCLPRLVRDEIARLVPDRLVLLGGEAAVGPQVAELTECETLPPLPSITVGDEPPAGTVPGIDGGPDRPLAELRVDGGTLSMVAEEVVVATDDDDALATFLAEVGGTVLASTDPPGATPTAHLVGIDLPGSFAQTDPATLAADLQWITSIATGEHAFSSRQALDTVAAAVHGRMTGLQTSLDLLIAADSVIGDAILDRDIGEAGGANPFAADQFALDTGPRTGVAEAWRLLAIAGREESAVTIGIVDGGFAASNTDIPSATPGLGGPSNPTTCGGSACPWHGTDVAQAAAGTLDNGSGFAGAAGPVGRLRLYQAGATNFSTADAVASATSDGVDVINMSVSTEIPASIVWTNAYPESVIEDAYEEGIFLVASAGNRGSDVDAVDCLAQLCWESHAVVPCEGDGVVCVGGTATGSRNRDPGSNYGQAACGGSATCDVEMFAPFTVMIGPNPANATDPRSINGTSFSSPLVAGVAALALAARPGRSPYALRADMIATANTSPDGQVSRVVNAHELVRRQLGPLAPLVRVTEPLGATPYGGVFGTSLAAEVHRATFHPQPTLTWNVRDAVTDAVVEVDQISDTVRFPDVGDHRVGVTAAVTGSPSGTDEVVVSAVNTRPAATIMAPDTATWQRDQPIPLSGVGQDPNEGVVDCASLVWTVTTSATPLATGCTGTITFDTIGNRNLVLTATDEQGATDTDVMLLTITEPPSTGPPTVTITSPSEGHAFDWGETISLVSVASDPDDDPITYEWQASANGTDIAIGTTPTLSWRPIDDLPRDCGGGPVTIQVTATAGGEQRSDAVDVTMFQPAC